MRRSIFLSMISLLAAIPATAMPSLAQTTANDLIPIHGTVASVDASHATVEVRFVKPGSDAPVKRTFALGDHNDVLRLKPGAVIDGTADTTRDVWVLSNINVESSKPLKGSTTP